MRALALSIAALFLVACGGAQHPRPWNESAEIAINGAAHAVAAADAAAAQVYTAQSQSAQTPADLDALEARFAPYVRSLHGARAALLGAQASVAVAVQTGAAEDRCKARMAVLGAIDAMQAAIPDASVAGLSVPDAFLDAVGPLETMVATLLSTCQVDGGVS